MMEPLLGKTLDELQQVAVEAGLPRFAGSQLARWLYVRRVTTFDQMTDLSLRGRQMLAERYVVGRRPPVAKAVSVDGTVKYLFEVRQADGGQAAPLYVESVFLPEDDRATACVSTQAGCRMGCRFCMTGTLGFRAHLTAADILNQIFEMDDMHGRSLTNIVYMGEGEPLDNLGPVLRSVGILTAPYALAWSPKRITVSTVGFLPGLQTFMEKCDCHLALSLHNPFHEERLRIMPAERAYPVADVLDMLRRYDFTHQRRFSCEYICFGGLNDTPRHARELVRLLSGLPCRVNLIRFHAAPPESGKAGAAMSPQASDGTLFAPSDEQRMLWLRDYLTAHGLTATIRRSRGEDILAACGMLVNALQSSSPD